MEPNKLEIRFAIHLEDHDLTRSIVRPHGPLFHRWLPNGQEDAIRLDAGDAKVSVDVWFKRHGTTDDGFVQFAHNKQEVDADVMQKQGVLDGGPLYGLVTVADLDSNQKDAVEHDKLASPEYKALARRVIQCVDAAAGRFVTLLRVYYGQYWLPEISPWDSRTEGLEDRCRRYGMNWHNPTDDKWSIFFRDTSDRMLCVTARWHPFRDYIGKNDWKRIPEQLAKMPDSHAAKMLNYAHQAMDQREFDGAFISGITALEIAIGEFVKRAITDAGLKNHFQRFWDLPLAGQVVALARFRGSSDEERVKNVVKAIGVRNKLIHEGIGPSTADLELVHHLFKFVTTLLSGPDCRFPIINSGNALKPPENWEAEYQREEYKSRS